MPPQLALIACLMAVLWLWWRDHRNNPTLSAALWVPIAWFSIIGSRFPSEWLGESTQTTEVLVEGSPLDRNVFLVLLVLGVVVLLKRQVAWGLVARYNTWIAIFFLYTAISILWSDFPFTAFKRWHKVFGHVVMALIVWTERDPERAVASVLRRCGCLLILLSVVLIKYFPDLGRTYSAWEFQMIVTGVTTNKNLLGNTCLIVGLFYVASLTMRRQPGAQSPPLDYYIHACLLILTFWVLARADSATSLLCLLIGSGVVVMTRIPVISRHFTVLLVGGVAILGVLQVSFNIRDLVITSLGRDVTLTGRTELWDLLWQMQTSPLFGAGFESFWLGDRVEKLWAIYWWKPNQAHNGFYETYLNIGLVGLCLQLAMMISGYQKARRKMLSTDASGEAEALAFAIARFSLAYMLVLAMYNWTEATFKALHLSYFVFFLIATHYPSRPESLPEAVAPSPSADREGLSPWSHRPAAAPAPAARVSSRPSLEWRMPASAGVNPLRRR
jgi:O-antigen ligase